MERHRPVMERAQRLWPTSYSQPSNLKMLGGALAALLVWGVIANFSDIKRYIRMSTM